MTITELYEQLRDPNFKNPTTANLFFPAYMYLYDPKREYEIREEITQLKKRLQRPDNYLDVLVLNVFEEFLPGFLFLLFFLLTYLLSHL